MNDGGASPGRTDRSGAEALLDGGASPGVGDVAADFAAPDAHGATLSMATLRGGPVLLVFVPFAFTPVCTDEAAALQRAWPRWQERGVRVVLVACDAVPTLRRWAEEHQVTFDVVSDFWPHGQIARAYGAFSARDGAADRVSMLIDAAGVVRWRTSAPRGWARPVADYEAAIADLLGEDGTGASGGGSGRDTPGRTR
ncbi:MAG TPA: redoxin domain-containing protein [Actinomycetaceae bacterium]|nr:redoxin domain-containing protein [Actinomycetaceae bacterium]